MYSWITPYLKQYKGRVIIAILFALLGVTSGAMLLFVSGYLISKSALRPENIMIVYVPIVAVRAFSIGQAVFPYIEKLVGHDIVLRILAKYRDRLYSILESQAVFLESRYQTGDLLSVLSDDIEKLQDFYIRTLLPALLGLVVYGILAIVLGFFDLRFMFIMILVLGVMVFLMPSVSYWMMRRKHVSMKKTRTGLYQQITDAMFGQLDWVVSGRVREVLQQTEKENNRLLEKERQIDGWHHIRDASLRGMAGIAIIVMMYWADLQTNEGTISGTVIAAFVLLMFSITDALIPVSDAVEEVPTYADSLARMNHIEKQGTAAQSDLARTGIDWQQPIVSMEGMTYRYEENETATIHQLSLTIETGQKVAILGKSGTGKSTLLKLLAGLITPDEGEILIDDVPMNQAYLGKAVTVLNQKPHLFHTTIANNIRIGNPEATDEEIIDVLKQAQIYQEIEKQPQGIHTQMDEMGKRFSGGERQRIAFARVLIQQTPILLLDEPTTGLDPKTERALLMTILEAAKDKTIIWVTHHLAGAAWMDDIIFLDQGKIKMQGSHEVLLQENDYYRELYEMDEGM